MHKHKTKHTEILFVSTSVELSPSTIKGIYIQAELQILPLNRFKHSSKIFY